ncbi:hypothetical protein ACFLT7_06705 [candidate division KSB1 bacterium]
MHPFLKYIAMGSLAIWTTSLGLMGQETRRDVSVRMDGINGFAAIQSKGELLWRDLTKQDELKHGDRIRTDVSSDIAAVFPGGGQFRGASVSYLEIAALPASDGSGLAGVKNLYGTILMIPPRDSLTYGSFLIIAQTDTIVGQEGMFTSTITDKGETIVTAVTGSVILRRGSSGRTIFMAAPGKLTLKPGEPEADPSDLDPADMKAIGNWAEGGPPWKPTETSADVRETWAYFLERQQEVWQRDPQIYLRLFGSFSEAAGEFIQWYGVQEPDQTEAGKGYFFIQDQKAVVEIKGRVP